MNAGDFWTRRKAAVEAEAEADLAALDAEETARLQAENEARPDAEILAELGLKDPDTLEPGDDFAAFMKAAVPERLRRRALRKLWLSNPMLANLDELVDYGEDFTDAATVVENLQTTYQVGKGMLKHILEMERLEALEETSDPVDADDEALIAADDEVPELAPVETVTEAPPAPAFSDETPPETDEGTPRRRMRFEFT